MKQLPKGVALLSGKYKCFGLGGGFHQLSYASKVQTCNIVLTIRDESYICDTDIILCLGLPDK